MSELKALDELRELAADVNSTEIIDHLDVVGKFMFHTEWLESWHEAFDAACAKIEREIAERFMELPVDKYGEVIRVGDVVAAPDCKPFEVRAMQLDPAGWFVVERLGSFWNSKQVWHHKPRTIEDVLRDCCNEWNEHLGNDWESGVYAKYADEIRELIGGGR